MELSPRKPTDKGGILCLPLDKNLNGDTQVKHPDWTPISCPKCGQKCWKMPIADTLKRTQGVSFLCTECAIAADLLAPYPAKRIQPKKNREQRRRK